MKIAAAYLRVSTEEQDEYSLDSQLKLIREYANKNDYIVPDEYVYVDDGISGRSVNKRKAFKTMVAVAKEKERPFDSVLLWKFSRFARNQEESIVYKTMLRKLGVSVVSISEPLPDGPFASLIERIIEWMDEFYSIRLSGEVKRGMLEKASRGEPVGTAPFGYRVGEKSFVPDRNADIVREVFTRYAGGDTMRGIATSLGSRGIRTVKGNMPDSRFIEYLLHNPVYIGKIRWSKEGRAASTRDYDNENIVIYDGNHEALISDELWERVQNRLRDVRKQYPAGARRNEPASWMLKGLVHCSACGSTLCYASMACPSMQCYSYAHGQCKTSHSLSIAKANKAVIAALENSVATLSFNMRPAAKKATVPADDTSALIKAEEKKLRRITEAYENGIDSLAEYAAKKKKVLAVIEELRRRQDAEAIQAKAPDPKEFAKKVSNVLTIIKDENISEQAKNEALRSIISSIVYNKSAQRLDIYFYA